MYTFEFDQCSFRILDICSGQYAEDVQGHRHSRRGYEIHYDVGGKGMMKTEDGRYALGENILYITGPDVYHRQTFDRKDPLREYCIYIELTKTGKGKTADEFLKRKFWIGEGTERIGQLMEEIRKTAERGGGCARIEMGALMQLLLCEIVKRYEPELAEGRSEWLGREIRIIEAEFMGNCQNVTLEGLAEKIHLSQRQTERILTEHFGKSFSGMKREWQIEKSLTYLEEKIPLSEIAGLCGFCDSPAYIRAFKKEKGMTPTEYKRKRMEGE